MTTATNKFSLRIGSEVSLKDFSFSQLIFAVKALFDSEGIPGFVKALVMVIELLVIKNGVSCPRCKCEKHHIHSRRERRLCVDEIRVSDYVYFRRSRMKYALVKPSSIFSSFLCAFKSL